MTKRARARRQRRVAARKALCVFVSVVLVVGLMPGWVAWGETQQQGDPDQTEETADAAHTEGSERGYAILGEEGENAGESDTAQEAEVESGRETLVLNADSQEGEARMVASEETDAVGSTYELSLKANSNAVPTWVKYDLLTNWPDMLSGDTVTVEWDNQSGTPQTFTTTIKYGNTSTILGSASCHVENGQKGKCVWTVPDTISALQWYTYNWGADSETQSNTIELRFLYTTPPTKTITLNSNGGSGGATYPAAQGSSVSLSAACPTAPTRKDYAFAGWNTAADGSGTHYDATSGSIKLTADTTLYAEWTRTAELVTRSGDTASPESVVFYYDAAGNAYYNKSTSAQTVAVPVTLTPASGWTKVGWTTSKTATAADALTSDGVAPSDLNKAETTFYVITSRSVSLAYADGGADSATKTVPNAYAGTQYYNAGGTTTQPSVELAAKPADLVKKGYSFGGWDINGTTYQPGAKFEWADDSATAAVTATARWNKITVTPPTAKTLSYTGSDQELVTAGSAATYTMQYSLSEGSGYSDSIPKAAAAGSYPVYYRVVDANGAVVVDPAGPVTASITAAAPTNVTEPAESGWTYDGATRALVTAGSATGGEMQYALGADGTTAPTSGWGTGIPSRKDAGDYFVWYKVVGDANHSDTTPAPIKVTVAQREATLEWSGTTFTYNGSDQAPTASVGNLISDDSCTVTVSVTGDHKAKGSYTATATGLSNNNYKLPGSATQAFIINPKPVGITWAGDELTYDGSAQKPTATLTAADIVSGDTCTVTVGGEQTNAGDYTATATLSDDNYTLATADASHAFTIAPLAATLSWGTTSFTYTGKEQAPTATVTNLRSQNGVKDACTVTVSGGRTDAGGPYTATATALSNPNYKLPVNATTSFSIAKAALTVKAEDNAITYGDAPSGKGVSYSGFVNGETEAVLSGTLAYDYSYTQFGDVGDSYEITPKGLAADNYAIAYANGTLKVEQREVTLVWSAPSEFDYTGSPITWPVPVVEGTVHGDVLTAVWKTATAGADDAYTATAAGTYKPVVDSLTATSPAKASNYKLPDDKTGTWKIKAPGTNNLTVRIEGWTYGKYNATANAPVATADFGTATFAYYKDAECKEPVDSGNPSKVPVDAGNYYVKATVADDPSDNYPGATAVAAFTIAKAKITVTADDKASVRSEDGIDTLTCSISGDLVPADEADLKDNYITLSCAADGKTAGIFSITVTAAEHKNYEITPAPGTYTVTRSLANVTAAGYTGAYDGTDDAADGKKKAITVTHPADAGITVYYSTESFENIIDAKKMALIQNADSIAVEGFSEAWAELTTKLAALETEQKCSKDNPSYSQAGDHEVFFIIVTEQSKADMIVGSKTVTITKPQLAVTAGDKAITYGDGPANDGVTYSGWVNGEDESVLDASNLSYSYGGYAAGKPVGSYVITPSGIEAANYELVYKPGTLTVGKRAIQLEWPDPSELAYNGKQQAYGPPTVKNPYGTDDVKAVCADGTDKAKDAGSYVAMVEGLSGAAAGNYELPADADKLRHAWKIKPAKLTVTANDSVITYGDAPAGNGVTYDKLLGDDAESSLTGTLTYAYTYRQYGGVGEYALTPSGLSSQNYDIDFKAGKLTVKSRVVTLTWPTSDSFDYTGAELTYGKPALGNIVNGDDVSVGDYAGNKATTAGTHTAEVTSLAGAKSGNYALPANKSHDWTIVGAANRATVTLEGWTYGDGPNEPAVEAAFGEDTAEFTYAASEDGPFGAAVPTAAGTYWVKATIAASGNHDGAEATAKFTIARRPATVTAKPQVVEVGGSVATGLDQVELTGAASGDVLSAIVLAGSSTASVTEAGTVTPSGAVLKDASGADMTANYDVTYKPGALLVAGVKAAENGKVVYALHKDIWMTVDEAGRIIDLGQAGRDEQLIDMADGHALLLATAEELGVIVKEDGGFTAKVGVYELVLKANPEVGVTAHVVSVAATDPATGVTVYANDTTPDADVLRKAKAGDADAIAALIELAGAVAFDRDGNQVAVTGIDLSAVDPDKPATYKATYSTAGGASATANLTVKEGGSGSGDGSGGGSSATKPGSTRKAASPATGDAMPVALLAATALASACALAFSWRRRESALPGKHARK